MTETNAAMMAGLPGDVRALLARPSLSDTRLPELAARWEGLTPAQARMADLTRPASAETVQRRQPRSRPPRSQRSQRKGRR